MKTFKTLLGDGAAVVIGIPSKFDLSAALKTATMIRLATAFALRSGWKHLEAGISKSKARMFLLAGLDFFQTEPGLLKDWLNLKLSNSDRVDVGIASRDAVFHPKVLIVKSDGSQPSFAVVGSGNLSNGGMQSNVECSLFTTDTITIDELTHWFDIRFARALPLNGAMIKAYEPKYNGAKKWRGKLAKGQANIDRELSVVGTSFLRHWDRAIHAAKGYFHTPGFQSSYASRQQGAHKIVKTLHLPDFTFSRTDWNAFYSIASLGRLDPRSRDKIFKKRSRLRTGLRKLIKEGERALSDILPGGSLHVDGVGLATITKILAAHDPKTWPVFNSRVEDALKDFGYEPPRGAGTADRYLAYRNTMKKFGESLKKGGSMDALALDAFFYHWSERLKKRQNT